MFARYKCSFMLFHSPARQSPSLAIPHGARNVPVPACLPRRRGRSIAYSFGARSLASTFRPRARSSSLRAAGYGVLPSVASSSPAWALPAAAHAVLIELDAGAATWHATVHCTAFRAGLYVYVAGCTPPVRRVALAARHPSHSLAHRLLASAP